MSGWKPSHLYLKNMTKSSFNPPEDFIDYLYLTSEIIMAEIIEPFIVNVLLTNLF